MPRVQSRRLPRSAARAPDPWCDAFADRLCRAAEGVPLREIARCTGYNHETIRRYMLTGQVRGHFVVVFAEAFGLSPGWLLTGRGPRRRGR